MASKQEVIDAFTSDCWIAANPTTYIHKTNPDFELHSFGIQNSELVEKGVSVGRLIDGKIYFEGKVVHG